MSDDTQPTARTARRAFGALNRVVEPAVRRGLGNSLIGPGVFVVETTGRRSGQPRRVPLLGVRLGDRLVVSTVRPNSQWVRNLRHDARAGVWAAGCRRPATAVLSTTSGPTVAVLTLAGRADMTR